MVNLAKQIHQGGNTGNTVERGYGISVAGQVTDGHQVGGNINAQAAIAAAFANPPGHQAIGHCQHSTGRHPAELQD